MERRRFNHRAHRRTLVTALWFAAGGLHAATPAKAPPTEPRYDIHTYPPAGGDQINIYGTWILVGNYKLTFGKSGIPPINYKVREIARIRPTNAPTVGQLQVCNFLGDWNETRQISSNMPSFTYGNNGAYRFDVISMSVMDVEVNINDSDFQLRGAMRAHKLSRNPDKAVGRITLTSTNMDFENIENPELVTLFNKETFPVSCFAEMKSDDRGGPSRLNMFTAIVKALPKASVERRHILKASFSNHQLQIDSEEVTVKGACCGEGHNVTLQKDVALTGEDAISDINEVTAFGGGPGIVVTNLYSTGQRLESTFHVEQASTPKQKLETNGTIILDALNPP